MLSRSGGLPLVSVGLPVYNGADHLGEALESVLQQDYGSLEVIICDNASEDGTAEIAQSYARRDERIRYLRNSANIGFLPNFRRVRDEATGKYFGWLAHDDSLSDPRYITTVVDYMERHPEVVACTTAFHLFDTDMGRSDVTIAFPELDPERWPASRRELFRWPHWWIDAAVYGVFRRDALARVPIRERRYRGRSHIFCWEMELLTTLSAYGPIVSIPDCLRTYRVSSMATGNRILRSVSSFDLLLLGMKMKLRLLGRAVRTLISAQGRWGVMGTVLANFFRGNVNQPYDLRYVMHWRERELELLQSVASERGGVIDYIRGEIEARREIAEAQGVADGSGAAAESDNASRDLADPPPVDQRKGSRGFLVDFFRPLADWQVDHFNQLNVSIAAYRAFCDDQLVAINRLQSVAEAWLRRIEPTPDAADEPGEGEAERLPAEHTPVDGIPTTTAQPTLAEQLARAPQIRTGRPPPLPEHARRSRWRRRSGRQGPEGRRKE